MFLTLDSIVTGIWPLSALIVFIEKRKKRKLINSKVSAKLSYGFYFEFNTIFSTATILTEWAI